MQKIKTVIVDDEKLARENIRLLLKSDPEINISGEFSNGSEAINFLNNNRINLMFLDIQMPEINGFDVLAELERDKIPIIIFVTAYDQFAIRAFKVHAIDYLLKPFSNEQFYDSLNNAKEFFRLKNREKFSNQLDILLENYFKPNPRFILQKNNEPAKKNYLTRFSVKTSNKIYLIKSDNIDWIEAADYYVYLHEGKNKHLLRESMNNLELKLNPEKFVRIHRSTIVNVDRVKAIESGFNGEYITILSDGTRLKLSRYRKNRLKDFINL